MFMSSEAPVCAVEDEALLYSVEMSTPGDDAQVTEVFNGPHTECIVGNLLPGATYRFRVRAANKSVVRC